jgi:uracil-DNA glycosylase
VPEIQLCGHVDFVGWRDAARRLLAAGILPETVSWCTDASAGLFAEAIPEPPVDAPAVRVPRPFVEQAELAIRNSDPRRFALLYRILWRLAHGEPRLLAIATDPDIIRLDALIRGVQRCAHKMKAFLRFKEIVAADGPHYLAWFEPEHHVLELIVPFLMDRFTGMRWSVVTPTRSARWDGSTVWLGPGGSRADVPAADALDETWRSYYASIFNPARLNLRAMQRHMPKKYWREMPETRLIPALRAAAGARASGMIEAAPADEARKGRVRLPAHSMNTAAATSAPAAGAPVPATLAEAAATAARCRACPLWEGATQTVFGEGPQNARVMLVGEQPGDHEDLMGRAFVGPAGRLLDRALRQAGLERRALYVTNAVKHFKFTLRGKRRIHQRPDAGEVELCRGWLDLERELVRPRLIVALGATAAAALLGRPVRVGEERGRLRPLDARTELLITGHPSAILRSLDQKLRDAAYRRLVSDLRLAVPIAAPAWPAAPGDSSRVEGDGSLHAAKKRAL